MTVREEIQALCDNAAAASAIIALKDTDSKNAALLKIADALLENTDYILEENAKDLENAGANGVPSTSSTLSPTYALDVSP